MCLVGDDHLHHLHRVDIIIIIMAFKLILITGEGKETFDLLPAKKEGKHSSLLEALKSDKLCFSVTKALLSGSVSVLFAFANCLGVCLYCVATPGA